MRILLTNDDGYDAPGIRAAYNALHGLGTVHVVAPRTQQSACSHMISLHGPITVERIGHELFGTVHVVEGTPADCVRLAWAELLREPVDLVVSGINAGANSGVDVFYSGTVAGAREGAILGIPSVAVSQALRTEVETDWAAAAEVTRTIVRDLVGEALPGPGFWSVNFPAPIPPDARNRICRVPVSLQPTPMTFERTEGDGTGVLEFSYGASYWLREADGSSDYNVIRNGGIAVSAIPLYGRF